MERASSSESQAPVTETFSPGTSSVRSVLPSRPSLWAMRCEAAARIWRGRAVITLQPDHRRAGEVVLEAQDVVDLGAAPAVDRLVVVADAADVLRSNFHTVIPGRAVRREPGIHTPGGGYGFRVRRFATSRNDGRAGSCPLRQAAAARDIARHWCPDIRRPGCI